MNYCHCGPRFKFDQAHKIPAPSDWQALEAWYCRQCERISHAVQEAVPVVRGPINARALLHASGKLNGQQFITWAVGSQDNPNRVQVETVEFFPWPRRPPMSENEPLIHLTWKLLMEKVAVIMRPVVGAGDNGIQIDDRERARQQARGIAEVLAIQMKPFMESADHVVKCAVKYHKDPYFEVPGLGDHMWNPMLNPDGSERTPLRAVKSAPAKPVARPKVSTKKVSLTPAEIIGVREAVGSGIISAQEMADMYNVSLATVEAALRT